MQPVSPMGAIQDAVYDVLTADVTLMTLVSGIYDAVPENAEFPYVVIGEALELPDDRLDGYGRETVLTLHVWSRHRGFSEATEILARLVTLLDHQSLTITSQHHVATRYEFSQTLIDPEPYLRHIPIRFRVVTEQT
jgi:hypothetical protein